MNLDDIRSMGIVEARKLKLEDVLRAVFEGETYTANDYRIEDEYHNAIEQGWEVRNSYDGNLVSRHRIQWTYHEPGVVKDIITTVVDASEGRKLETAVKHEPDPIVQPTVTRKQLPMTAEELSELEPVPIEPELREL